MANVPAKGDKIQVSISAVWTTIAQCTDIGGGAMEARDAETSYLEQASNGAAFEPTGFVETEPFSMKLMFDPALSLHQTVLGYIQAPRTNKALSFRRIFADGSSTTWSWTGYFQKVGSFTAGRDGWLECDVAIRVTGLISLP